MTAVPRADPDAPIPTAPRAVPLRTALRCRWVLGLCSGLTALSLLPVLIVLAASGVDLTPFGDDALDAGASTAQGVVTAIEATSMHSGERRFTRIRYRFLGHQGAEHDGASICDHVELTEGGPCTVDYLADEPEINRLSGTRRQVFGLWFGLLIAGLGLPAVALFLYWVREFVRCRLLLAEGRVGEAVVERCRPLRLVNPPQLRVEYSFRDRSGEEYSGWQWVSRRSALGKLLDGGLDRVAVVYDEVAPGQSRLCVATDFARR